MTRFCRLSVLQLATLGPNRWVRVGASRLMLIECLPPPRIPRQPDPSTSMRSAGVPALSMAPRARLGST